MITKPKILICISILFLSACGTFEVGFENNVVPQTQVETAEPPTGGGDHSWFGMVAGIVTPY